MIRQCRSVRYIASVPTYHDTSWLSCILTRSHPSSWSSIVAFSQGTKCPLSNSSMGGCGTAQRLHQCRVTPTVFEVRICMHLRRRLFDSASSKNSSRKLTRLDSNGKSVEAPYSLQRFLAAKKYAKTLQNRWQKLQVFGEFDFPPCVDPTWTRVTAASMLPGSRWKSNGQSIFPVKTSVEVVTQESRKIEFMLSWRSKKEAFESDRLFQNQTKHDKTWLSEWGSSQSAEAFCTCQHQCRALVVVAAFEWSLGCHGTLSCNGD